MDNTSKKNPKNSEESDDKSAKSIDELKDEIRKLSEKQDKILKVVNKKTKIIAITTIPTIIIILIFVFSANHYFVATKEIAYGLQSNYEIEDLKGEKIDTWVSWRITPGDPFHIHVQSSPEVTDHRLQMIRDVIFSNDTTKIDNQTYYKGWDGAVQEVSKRYTKFPIPLHFHTVITDFGNGNIIIKLTNLENADGYSGYTKSIMDVSNHQLLKSEVTIYKVDQLDDEQFKTILRHELGHGFGLGHSDVQGDLMYPMLDDQNYGISECDIQTLAGLYSGEERSHVICTK